MFTFFKRYTGIFIMGGILVFLFLSGDSPPPPPHCSSVGMHMQDQCTQTDSWLTDYIVIEYV